MGQQKKYYIKTINFGEIGNPVRDMVEAYVKQKGKTTLSELMRRLVFISFSDRPEHKDWKIKMLMYERKELSNHIVRLVDQRTFIENKLRELGQEPE